MDAGGRAAIDRLRSADGTLDRRALLSILPYGEDFLFVDRVTRLEPDEVEASYRIPSDTPWIRSHFRDLPIMPGALVAEGWAQAGTVMVRYGLDDSEPKVILGIQIDRARFAAPAFPGDVLDYRVRLKTRDSRAARLEGEARIGERRAATLSVAVGIMGVEAFRRISRR